MHPRVKGANSELLSASNDCVERPDSCLSTTGCPEGTSFPQEEQCSPTKKYLIDGTTVAWCGVASQDCGLRWL